jgi:hypothetical protein
MQTRRDYYEKQLKVDIYPVAVVVRAGKVESWGETATRAFESSTQVLENPSRRIAKAGRPDQNLGKREAFSSFFTEHIPDRVETTPHGVESVVRGSPIAGAKNTHLPQMTAYPKLPQRIHSMWRSGNQ